MTQDGLPAERVITALAGGMAVFSAPPGSGKTTILPPALLAAPWLSGRRMIILEPRRLAARLAARRLADNLGCPLGREVGLAMRFESAFSEATRILVVTEGVMVRMLQDDPELTGCALVVFDEFHERSLAADLALALCLDVRGNLRPDLRLLFMSATLDAGGIGRALACPVVEGGRRPHPVEKVYLPPPGRGHDFHTYRFGPTVEAAAAAVIRAVKERPGDVLVFLPGVAEIKSCKGILEKRLAEDAFAVLPLYGDLPRPAQDAAVRRVPGKRRVILATPVAETSITIEGVSVVVDSGFARRPRFDPGRGMGGLVTARISRAEARQRAGRAGRTGPGTCYRLWPESHHGVLAEAPPLEIRNADLAGLALELLRWGVRDPAALTWLDPPPAAAFGKALELLERLGFADQNGLTARGREAAGLPVHPRLAALVLKGCELGCAATACGLAALLSERDLLAGEKGRGADLETRLALLRTAAGKRAAKTARRLLALCRGAAAGKEGMTDVLLAAAWPERIARLRPGSRRRYLLAGGAAAELDQDDPLAGEPFLVVAELQRISPGRNRIRLAAAADIGRLREFLPRLFATRQRVFFDPGGERVRAVEELACGAVVCESRPLSGPDPEEAAAVLVRAVRERRGLVFSPGARRLMARALAARRLDPGGGWPDLGEAALYADLEQWLPLWAPGANSLAETKRVDMEAVMRAMLGPERIARLDRDLPETITTPAGTRARIDYSGKEPVLAARIQELFGMRDTPRIMGGKAPLLLHLLSPAMRPVQVTRDLRSFWRNSYPEVRKELRGRYPKHPWPEDPENAEPWRPGRKKR